MLPVLLEPLLHTLGRIVPSDVTRVYQSRSHQSTVATTEFSGWEARFMLSGDLRPAVGVQETGLDVSHVDLLERGEARCFALCSEGMMAAYAWFAEGHVAARHNTGGPSFRGIGLKLAPGVSYLFKALVLPRYRGRGLMTRLIQAASCALQNEGKDRIVTTTDIANRAFQKSVENAGFLHTDHAAELVLFGRHWFRLPEADGNVTFVPGGAE